MTFNFTRNLLISKLKILLPVFILLATVLTGYAQTPTEKSLADNPAQLRRYVTDETGTLTASQISTLNNKLVGFEKTTSNQVIVYIIPDLKGESLEDLSIRLAEKNKIGKKDKNNGVLLLIVKNDRKIRIEVGYGLEGALTDAICSQIIRNEISPNFKKGKFYEGIFSGIESIMAVTKGEYTAEKEKDSKSGSGECCFGIPIFVVIIFIFIFFSIITSFIRSIFGFGKGMYTNKKGNWSSGGFGGGSWGSGGSSGGFGGGGFSGGGGSFGGGGASGSW